MTAETLWYESYGSNSEQHFYYEHKHGITKSLKMGSETGKQNIISLSKQMLKSVFLPRGYPESVSKDYLQYQLWDTLQAFCSSITGTLATQAVLKGYGVGDKTATAAAATITWMLKDGAGMIGRILFAWKKGTQLDCDAKRWRLVADILNDCAILLDLIAPMFKNYFLLIACFSSIARSIVGVAGGATRAALTLHQARRDNMADVSAKDGSQETLVNLVALISGFVITPLVADDQSLVWFLFFLFTFLHLLSNYQAVSAVVMTTINLPRLHLLMKHSLLNDKTLSPEEVAKLDPVLRSPGYTHSINIGCQLNFVLKCNFQLENHKYWLGYDRDRNSLNISLMSNASSQDVLRSCYLALLIDLLQSDVGNIISKRHGFELSNVFDESGSPTLLKMANTGFSMLEKDLKSTGWDLSRCHLGADEWRTHLYKKPL